jgi:hypothetical protein
VSHFHVVVASNRHYNSHFSTAPNTDWRSPIFAQKMLASIKFEQITQNALTQKNAHPERYGGFARRTRKYIRPDRRNKNRLD